MSLKGNIKTMPLGDLLRLIGTKRSTGTFELSRGTSWKRLYFEKGTVISAGSSDPSEYLGHFLISENKITEEQLTQAIDVQKKTRVMIGKILVMIGAITEPELLRLLEVKCLETLMSMFLWEDADFEFFEDQLPAVRLIPAAVVIDLLVEEGVKRHAEWREIKKKYPARDIVFGKDPSRLLPADAERSLRGIYDLVDGKRTIGDIIMQTHSTEYRVLRSLHRMKEDGVLWLASTTESQPPQMYEAFALSHVVENGKNKLNAGRWEDAINLFNYVLQHEENQEARDLLTRAEHGLVESIYANIISPESVPKLARPIESLIQEKLSSEESFVVTRINGRWDMKSILTITPLREVEALRIVKRLMDRKIIEI